MKKNLFFAAVLCIGLTALFISCDRDTFTELDAYSEQRKNEMLQDSITKSQLAFEAELTQKQALLLDSLKKVGGVINYSVGVVVASESSWLPTWDMYGGKGSKGLDAATVTIAQHGIIKTVTTDASGIASFKDLRIGTANVNVRKTGYTTVDFVVDLPPLMLEEVITTDDGDYITTETTNQRIADLVRHVATMIPVFSLTDNLSTITGIVTVESDLTNDAPEPAAGIKIKGIIDVEDDDFIGTYLQHGTYYTKSESSSWFDLYGVIQHIAFGSMVSTATTGADGSFTLQVPSSPQGLPIKIRTDEFALNQSILQGTKNMAPVWGVQSIRTLFGWGDLSYSNVPTKGFNAGQYQSAYVEFSAPTGSPAAQPTSNATATAVLTSSGIVSVNITNPGEGYTQAPYAEFSLGSAFNSVKATGTAVISGGKVTEVTITSPGSGYMPGDESTVTFYDGVIETAYFQPEFTFSILDINMTDGGSGYGSTPPAVTITGSGTGATAEVKMSADIKEINMTAMGSGYTQAPQVVISDNFGAWEEAEAVMTTQNPLFSINYDGTNPTLWPATPAPTAVVTGDGAGATASVTLAATGKVTAVTVGAGGSGYTSAPVVTFSGGGGGFGAAATATIDGGGAVIAVNLVDPGQGYTSIPTVAFAGGGGTGATATAAIGFPVATIAMTAAGVGYSNVTSIEIDNGTISEEYYDYCDIKFNHSVREVDFDDSGWFFSAAPSITFNSRDGNGSGAAATAVIEWWIYDILVNNPGSGYKEDDDNDVLVRIAPPPGAGTQATASAVLYNGKLSATNPWNHGEGYTAVPNVYMVDNDGGVPGPIKQAELTATVSNGHVTALTITDPGEGYDYESAMDGDYAIVISTYNSSAAAEANPNPESGKIAYITVSGPGAGYAVVPTVEINNPDDEDGNYQGNANGFGTGAAATAVVTDGRVTAINVTNAGSGYYVTPEVNITVASAVKTAMGRCVVSNDGRITSVTFNNPATFPGYEFNGGFGYDSPPAVTFFPSVPGKGTGATGVAVVADGEVIDVIMTNQGSGYTGMNKPLQRYPDITPSWRVKATGGKSYVRDIYMGTGWRTMEQ
jgi:hypothetical protein